MDYVADQTQRNLILNNLKSSAKRGVDFRSDWALSWGHPMSRFTALQGLICDANPQGVAQSPLQSTTSHSMYFLACHSKFIVIKRKIQQYLSVRSAVAAITVPLL